MPKTFEPNKNAGQLGIDKTRKFVVVKDGIGSAWPKGTVLTLFDDDGSSCPYFKDEMGRTYWIAWYRLAYADEPKEPEKFAVHCPTQADYDRLMEAYERKGWMWFATREVPSGPDHWKRYGSETAVDFHDNFQFADRVGQRQGGYTIISVDEALRRLGEPEDESSYMQNVIQKIKDLALTETDRALRRNGFEDEQGKLTNTAEQMMLQEIVEERWKARREDVAAKLKQVEEESKK